MSLKYSFAVASLLMSSSYFLYNITEKSQCFWFILGGLTIGSFVGIFFYIFLAYACNKLVENTSNNIRKALK
ncbi:hypothetical protein EBU91_02730 [bacterium]|nr:hypothetical protein [bacterium]